MMSDDSTTQTSPRRNWVRWLLILSLGLNLLIVGVVVGAVLRFSGPDHVRAPSRSMGIAVIRELPREDRRDMFRQAREASGLRRGTFDRDWQALIDLLQADQFDRSAAEAILARGTEARDRFERSLQGSLLDKLAAMSPQERSAYAQRLIEERAHHDKKKSKLHKDGHHDRGHHDDRRHAD